MASLPVDLVEVFESVTEGILVVDPDSRVTRVNRAASEILGIPKAALEGKRCGEVLGTLVCELIARATDAGGPGAEVRDAPLRYVAPDGAARSLLVNASALRGPDGRPHGTVAVFRDVTLLTRL